MVDLLLLRDLTRETGTPSHAEIKAAILDVFAARAHDAAALDYPEHAWPTTLTAYPHWAASFDRAASPVSLPLTLDEAVTQMNTWLDELDAT